MADQAAIISRVRRRVHDTGAPPLYADPYYADEVTDGLARANIDLGTSYTLGALPTKYDLLVILRASIGMCYVRAGEGASTDVSDVPDGPISTISVPNLSVTQMTKALDGPGFWMDLAVALEREYQSLLDKVQASDGTAADEIQVGTLVRRSHRTGGRTAFALDKAPDAPLLSGSVEDGEVTLTWNAYYSERFWRYSVRRSTVVGMTRATELVSLVDNHEVLHADSPGAGTWYYTVSVVNDNGLEATSAPYEAVVV